MDMNKLSILLLTLAAAGMMACSGNVKYDVTGNNVPEEGVVYLIDKISSSPIDSAVIADGAFKMTGKAPKDAFLAINVNGSDWSFPFINDGEPVQVNIADTLLTGSALNNKISECDLQGAAVYAGLRRMVDSFLALPKEEQEVKEDEFIGQYRAKVQEMADIRLAAIEENMDNLVPVAFIELVPSLMGEEKLNELLASGAPFTQHPFVQDFKRRMDAVSALEKEAEDAKLAIIGQKFLDLEEADPDGNMHKLSEYVGKGKWVLVDFWASWCGPCKAEMPNVVEAYRQYHDKGFDIVGLSFDREKEPWVQAIAEWEMPWIHLSDLQYWSSLAAQVYSVNSIPDNLLIDPDGTIVARGLRGDDLAAKLAEVF